MTRADAAGQPVAHLIEQVQSMCHLSTSQMLLPYIKDVQRVKAKYVLFNKLLFTNCNI